MADDPTSTVPPEPANGVKATREFQYLVGGALGACLLLQGILMWKLLTAQPPDSSWDLIKSLMQHLGQVDLLLIGGLLGLAQQSSRKA